MGKYIRTLTVFFDTDISYKEIPLFRGAVLKSLGDKANVLYHNHTSDDTFRYSYPLIQYKRLSGKAAIVCIEEGADLIGQFFSNNTGNLHIGERVAKCDIGRMVPEKILMQVWKASFKYHINRWLPLNAKNYLLYQKTEGMIERIQLLENILKANLLSMLKGLGIFLEEEINLKIINLSDSYIIYNKGVALMAFNVDITCNLFIPNNLGIGKNASIGFGVIHQKKNESLTNNTVKDGI